MTISPLAAGVVLTLSREELPAGRPLSREALLPLVRRALAQRTDVTKLIIAQRLTSVMDADQIVILEDGRVHAVGTHAQLLASDPIYQEIYHSQMRGGDQDGQSL